MKHPLTTGPVARSSPLYRLVDRAGRIHPATPNWVVVCMQHKKLKGTMQVLCPICHAWQACDDNGECIQCAQA